MQQLRPRKFFKDWDPVAVTPVSVAILGVIVFVASVVPPALRPQYEVISSRTSPNDKWSISEEYEWQPSRFRIILRDLTGKEIASGNERVVNAYLIDEPSDWGSKLAITDETAGTKDHLMWRLDPDRSKWVAVPK